MKRNKKTVFIAFLTSIITAAIAVCVVFAASKAGILPLFINKSPETTQNTSEGASDTVSLPEETEESTSQRIPESTEESTQGSTEQTTESTTGSRRETLYTSAALNVRTGPGTSYDKIGMLVQGAKVTRVGEENGWSLIEYNGGVKYVSSEYLTREEPTTGETNISQVERKVVDPAKGNWELVVVNAYIEYDRSYKPKLKEVCPGMGYDRYLDERAADHYTEMYKAAKKDGITLVPVSGYRSYEVQERNWKNRIKNEQAKGYGYNEAVARASEVILPPGTSEHNIGIAMDICSLYESFANTKEYAWLCAHAEDYGFILRYKAQWKSKTGIVPEPWHWRYVGVENAKKINASGLCLEEYVEKYGTS